MSLFSPLFFSLFCCFFVCVHFCLGYILYLFFFLLISFSVIFPFFIVFLSFSLVSCLFFFRLSYSLSFTFFFSFCVSLWFVHLLFVSFFLILKHTAEWCNRTKVNRVSLFRHSLLHQYLSKHFCIPLILFSSFRFFCFQDVSYLPPCPSAVYIFLSALSHPFYSHFSKYLSSLLLFYILIHHFNSSFFDNIRTSKHLFILKAATNDCFH